ncbi:MAG TPA: DUF3303 family protein [Tepidisphaeraceae bacterium]|nr:DUF3303 family protein [Tepidisphaeraceae bacterium]
MRREADRNVRPHQLGKRKRESSQYFIISTSFGMPRYTPVAAAAIGLGPRVRGFHFTREGWQMKYIVSWFERPQGSPIEYENAQKRILEVFGQWKAPANFKIEFFVIRVGEWGGHMLLDCDDLVTIHKFCSMLPAFVFQVHPVIPVEEAVRGELEVMAWRDGLKRK